jgi:hypothetical protein
MARDVEFLKVCKENPNNLEPLKTKIHEALGHYLKYILPKIMKTGTQIDADDEVIKNQEGEDIMDMNQILGFEVLPVVLQ